MPLGIEATLKPIEVISGIRETSRRSPAFYYGMQHLIHV